MTTPQRKPPVPLVQFRSVMQGEYRSIAGAFVGNGMIGYYTIDQTSNGFQADFDYLGIRNDSISGVYETREDAEKVCKEIIRRKWAEFWEAIHELPVE